MSDLASFIPALERNYRGESGFPYAERWKADLAKMCSVVLASIVERSEDGTHGQMLADEISALSPEQWVVRLTDPVLFAWCTEAQKLPVVTESTWRQLHADLGHNYGKIYPCTGSQLAIWSTPNLEFLRRMRLAGPGSLGDSCSDASFLDPCGVLFADARAKIGEAMTALAELAPGYRADVEQFVSALGLADDRASFRGSSALGRFGLVWFSPRATWPYQIWAEELVHEATHYIIDCIGAGQPLLLGDDLTRPRFPSPLRSDLRPAQGVFHALVVTGRILKLIELLRSGGRDYSVSREREDILRASLARCVKVFTDSVQMSVMGSLIFRSNVTPALA